MIKEKTIAYLFLLPSIAFLVVFILYPVFGSLWLSLHRVLLSLPALGEPYVGLQNFIELLNDPVALASFKTTLFFVLITTFLELFSGLLIALVIHKSFSGRGIVRACVLVPWAIPTVVASQMWRFIFNDRYGLLNLIVYGGNTGGYRAWLAYPSSAFFSVVAADVWKTAPFAALILLAGLQTIPGELYEAARIDGASAWKRFTKITLPLLRPAILVALLFRTIDAFRVFDLVFVMTQGGPANATNVLQFYGYKKMFTEGDMGYGSAISVIVFIIIFLLSMLYIRVVGKGLFIRHEGADA